MRETMRRKKEKFRSKWEPERLMKHDVEMSELYAEDN